MGQDLLGVGRGRQVADAEHRAVHQLQNRADAAIDSRDTPNAFGGITWRTEFGLQVI